MNLRLRTPLFLFATVAASTLLTACHSREDRSRAAFDDYQTATAQGDPQAVRRALLALVAADDTVADYWVELGKVQVQLGDFGAAYNAFQRAHELNRADPVVLAYMTQISLRAGNMDQAEQNARDLELVAPNDPAVHLTYGYVALRRGDLEEADRQAAALLTANAFDPSGKILRSRVLLQRGQADQAIALLRAQIVSQPSDQLSLRALLGMLEYRGSWSEAADTARALLKWQPKDQAVQARLIDAELRAGRSPSAIHDTAAALGGANADQVEALLAPWLSNGQPKLVAPTVVAAAEGSDSAKQVALAEFLLRAGEPKLVADLMAPLAGQPVTAGNIAANALYGTAIGLLGQGAEGLQRLSDALALDGGNAAALRGRAEIRSKAGQHQGAIEDAQKFVAADRGSPEARLLLAQVYVAAGRPDDAKRTLWDGFHEIPAERTIYEALAAVVARSDGPGAAQSLTEEYNDQRTEQMIRSFA